jgi:hypothetical protein
LYYVWILLYLSSLYFLIDAYLRLNLIVSDVIKGSVNQTALLSQSIAAVFYAASVFFVIFSRKDPVQVMYARILMVMLSFVVSVTQMYQWQLITNVA